MSAREYLALIGDFVASRKLTNRQGIQEKVIAEIRKLNQSAEFGPEILAAPLTLTAGDEVQAVFRKPESAVAMIQELTDRFGGAGDFPVIIFGLGKGSLSTEPAPDPPDQLPNPALADGPCFHLAREALVAAKDDRRWVRCAGLDTRMESGLNGLFSLMGAVRSAWTAKQRINTYQVRRLKSQSAWARDLGVSPSVVSESLKAARYDEILEGESAARELLRGALLAPTKTID